MPLVPIHPIRQNISWIARAAGGTSQKSPLVIPILLLLMNFRDEESSRSIIVSHLIDELNFDEL